MFDVVLADWRKTVGVLFGIPNSGIECSARVASKANWTPCPGLKLLAQPAISEQQSQAAELIIHERIHWIQDHGPHSGVIGECARSVRSFKSQFPQDGQKETFR